MASLAAAEKSSLLDPILCLPPPTFTHLQESGHPKPGVLLAPSDQHAFHNPPSHVPQTTLVLLPRSPDKCSRLTFPRRLRKTHPCFSLNRLLKRDFLLIAQWQAKIPHNLRAICQFYQHIDFSRLKKTESRPLCPQKGKLLESCSPTVCAQKPLTCLVHSRLH